MRTLILLSVAALAGCASSSSNSNVPSPTRVETVRVTGSGQPGDIAMGKTSSDPVVRSTTLNASIEDVWRVLPAVYDSLGITLTTRDAATHSVGNTGFSARRRLGKAPTVRYFDCGSTQGGPSADSYDLHLSVVSQLTTGDGAGTKLATTVEAMGRPVAFSGEYVRCSSTGVLEARIVDGVSAALH